MAQIFWQNSQFMKLCSNCHNFVPILSVFQEKIGVAANCSYFVPILVSTTSNCPNFVPISGGTPILLQFLPSPVQGTGWVSILHVSQSVCLCVTIILLILLLTLNYHSPPLYAGQFILLKPLSSKYWRRDQFGPV